MTMLNNTFRRVIELLPLYVKFLTFAFCLSFILSPALTGNTIISLTVIFLILMIWLISSIFYPRRIIQTNNAYHKMPRYTVRKEILDHRREEILSTRKHKKDKSSSMNLFIVAGLIFAKGLSSFLGKVFNR